ncbi:ABC transporter permease [Pseudomonas sp. B28(2017)]|uniref:ABC transporter permease n=1 Tax=Pseudomonas sp. B28(2017) TaxID=1981730 RepID=UPI000A1F242E|nr:ABC transporter permease [Pseudomonas sp. B28(2017)]
MTAFTISRSFSLAWLFVKEQLKEPVALFWIIVSPAATYYLLAYSRGGLSPSGMSYLESTSWFHAYVSSSVAFFAFSFYIVGRRESGFIRSFVYTSEAKLIFMLAQFFACSLISLIYCAAFYMLTRFSFGGFGVSEFLLVFSRFYICYVMFCVPGVLLGFLPVSFQNANTIFSVTSFGMLVLGVLSIRDLHPALDFVKEFNPLYVANKIMVEGVERHPILILGVFFSFVAVFLLTLRFLRINPVWSRY